jgi:hypothetical protein
MVMLDGGKATTSAFVIRVPHHGFDGREVDISSGWRLTPTGLATPAWQSSRSSRKHACIAKIGSAQRNRISATKAISVAVSIRIKRTICRHPPRADITDDLGCERA